ncbi:MAG TPA: hypothetical protein VGZ23_08905 [bacterium]|nr:hypothetical protein [bacterium]
MATTELCSKCGRPYTPGAKGWVARLEGDITSGRTDAPLRRILLCPEDYAKLPPSARMAWHEYTGRTQGPTREKRPGRLGDEAAPSRESGRPGRSAQRGRQ